MKKIKGFTFIELTIVLAIIGIIAAVLAPLFTNNSATNEWDVDCKAGYKFVRSSGVQIIDENGRAIPCLPK